MSWVCFFERKNDKPRKGWRHYPLWWYLNLGINNFVPVLVFLHYVPVRSFCYYRYSVHCYNYKIRKLWFFNVLYRTGICRIQSNNNALYLTNLIPNSLVNRSHCYFKTISKQITGDGSEHIMLSGNGKTTEWQKSVREPKPLNGLVGSGFFD